MAKVFPASAPKQAKTANPPQIKVVKPTAGKKLSILAVVRELLTETKKTKDLAALGGVGSKLFQLPKGALWQATLVVNNELPNLAYTCVLSPALGLPKSSKNKVVFGQLEAKVAGDHAIWLITEIQLV